MAFINQEYDMAGTIFTADQLYFARSFLTEAIKKHDPRWLLKPDGCLSHYWRDDALPAVCYLIELSRILSTLDRNVTKKSEVVFVQKFKKLLRAKRWVDYESLLTEFQVACMLSDRASPVALSPLVPEELLGKSQEPHSPDFAIRLPSGDVFIEATVFHLGILDQWDSAAQHLSREISGQLIKKGVRRIVRLYLPVPFEHTNISKQAIREICTDISSVNRGSKLFNGSNTSYRAMWEPMPHILTNSDRPEIFPNGFEYGTFGPDEASNAPAITIETWPSGTFQNELVLKSLRNTLNTKRKQFPHEGPYVLVIKLGHYRLVAEGLIALLNERIWPNSDYGWIMGIALFRPREQFQKPDALPNLNFIFNPNSRNKPSDEFIALVEGKQTYHL